MIDLKNKKIIVTGAAKGIGKEIVIQCINFGALVIAVDTDEAALEVLKKQVNSENIYTYTADVSKQSEVKQIFSFMRREGIFPDCLVNNAGIYYGKSIFEYNDEEIDKVMAVNIKSAVYCSKEFAQYKFDNKEQGCIVNISSVAGLEGSSDAIYGLTKAALIGLTKSNAINFSPLVRVNAVAPGVVDTSMMKVIPKERLSTYRINNHHMNILYQY